MEELTIIDGLEVEFASSEILLACTVQCMTRTCFNLSFILRPLTQIVFHGANAQSKENRKLSNPHICGLSLPDRTKKSINNLLVDVPDNLQNQRDSHQPLFHVFHTSYHAVISGLPAFCFFHRWLHLQLYLLLAGSSFRQHLLACLPLVSATVGYSFTFY